MHATFNVDISLPLFPFFVDFANFLCNIQRVLYVFKLLPSSRIVLIKLFIMWNYTVYLLFRQSSWAVSIVLSSFMICMYFDIHV